MLFLKIMNIYIVSRFYVMCEYNFYLEYGFIYWCFNFIVLINNLFFVLVIYVC